MPRLPALSGDEFVKIMRQAGFVWDHTEGSHMILLHPTGRRLSVPRHKALGRGLLRALITDAGLSREEFLRLQRGEAESPPQKFYLSSPISIIPLIPTGKTFPSHCLPFC